MKSLDCAGCRYWKRIVPTGMGKCSAPLPESLRGLFIRLQPTPEAAGHKCPARRKRIERKKKAPAAA